MSNPFTLSFGKKPYEYISRIQQTDEILHDFNTEHPVCLQESEVQERLC